MIKPWCQGTTQHVNPRKRIDFSAQNCDVKVHTHAYGQFIITAKSLKIFFGLNLLNL